MGNGGGSYGIYCPDTNTDIDLPGIPDGICIVNLRYFFTEVTSPFTQKISCEIIIIWKIDYKAIRKKGLKTERKVKCNKCNWEKRIKGKPECPVTSVKEYLSSFTEQTQAAFSKKDQS